MIGGLVASCKEGVSSHAARSVRPSARSRARAWAAPVASSLAGGMDQQVGARGDVPGRLGPVRGPGCPPCRQGADSGPCAWAGALELVTHGPGGAARAAALGLDGLGAPQGAATAPEPGARAG